LTSGGLAKSEARRVVCLREVRNAERNHHHPVPGLQEPQLHQHKEQEDYDGASGNEEILRDLP
jgi:hypothetical protein